MEETGRLEVESFHQAALRVRLEQQAMTRQEGAVSLSSGNNAS